MRPVPEDDVQIGVADPSRGDGHLHLTRPGRGEFHLGNPDRPPGSAENRGPDPATRPTRSHPRLAYWLPSAISANSS